MNYLDLTLPTLPENLALDEALLLSAEAGQSGEVLRFWEWPKFAVVLGAGCRLADDVNDAACSADGIPIARRSSGGGTVLLGPGCLLFTLVLGYDRSPLLRETRSSYCYILQRLQKALARFHPDASCAGTSDLTLEGRKFSGNAQQRKRHHFLHHGTLLYEFDLNRIGRYLHMPARQPEYRRQRDHGAFLMNLATDPASVKAELCAIWEVENRSWPWPQPLANQLTAEQYTQRQWIYRR
jgi:lipoate-protein ligase A